MSKLSLLALFIAARRSLIVTMFSVVITHSLMAQIKNGGQSNAVTRSGDTSDRSAQVDALITSWAKDDTPGAAIIVIQDGKILHRKGYGLANLATKTPITAETVFCLGSITKQFTAMAVMMLVERGKLHYDDMLSHFLPEFPAYAKKITIRHLLQHSAGLPDLEKILYDNGMVKWEPGGFEPTLKDIVALLSRQKELRFEPGAKWEYSNSGYVILAAIVEKVSGQRLRDFAKENIFTPLGMSHTLIRDESRPKLENGASSYGKAGTGFKNMDYHPVTSGIYGAGGVYSTLDDLYKWDQALYTERLATAATLRQAFTSGKLSDGSATGYGLGWQMGESNGLNFVAHGGWWMGFKTYFRRYPEQRFTVVALANLLECDPKALADQISSIYLAEKMTLPTTAKVSLGTLRKYAGKYELPGNVIVEVTLENDALWVKDRGPDKARLAPVSDTKFQLEKRGDISLEFKIDEKGVVTSLMLNGTIQARKLE